MKLIIITLVSFIYINAHASILPQDKTLKLDYQNDYKTISNNKKMVKKTIKNLKKAFRKDAFKRFGKISINDVWWSTTFNAYAMKYGPIWKITVHGGLLKHPKLTPDLLSLVLCHELGHFLGAAPKFTTFGKKWSSIEGQADYWTGQKCLKEIFKDDDNLAQMNRSRINPTALKSCQKVYETKEDQALCYRVAMAGLEMGELIADIKNTDDPALDTPDPNVVEQTYVNHPKFQCRVDTYFQASLCANTDKLSDEDPNQGTCEDQELGQRPQCWYRSE